MNDTGSRPMNLVEALSQDSFKLEEKLALFGRPLGMILVGAWMPDGSCEGVMGLTSLEPMEFCRIVVALRFEPGTGLFASRVIEADDPRDDQGVIERFFEKPVEEIMAAISIPVGNAFAKASAARADAEEDAEEEDDDEDMPIRELAASVTLH